MTSLYSLPQILSVSFIPHRELQVKFLNEVYKHILIRANGVFNLYTFQEIVNIPMIIAEKIYLTLTNYSLNPISTEEFSVGLHSLLYASFDDKIKCIFNIFDFDNDSIVNYADLFLILSHFHMIDNGGETVECLRGAIEEFIQRDEEIDKAFFLNRCKKTNCDIAVLMMFFINRYVCFFEEDEVKFFGENCYEDFCDKENSDGNELKGVDVGISFKLQRYFDKTELLSRPRKGNVTYEEKISFSIAGNANVKECNIIDEDDDFDELNNFEKDLTAIMITSKTEKKHCLMGIQSSKTFEGNLLHMQNSPHRKEAKEPQSRLTASPKMLNRHNNSLNKTAKSSTTTVLYPLCYTKSTNEVSTNEDSTLGHNNTKLKSMLHIYDNNSNSLVFPEFILLQGSPSSNTQCKLVISHSFIFLFSLLNNQFIYSKMVLLNGLFVKSSVICAKKTSFHELKFISNIHNHIIEYYFYTTSEDTMLKVKSLIKRRTSVDSINDKFSTVKEIGRGKFGQVHLVEDKRVQGFYYAMKTVKKKCATEEEYKINRWESSIFIFLTRLKHPNVIECLEYYETEESIYYIFEHMKGGDLKTYVKGTQAIPSETIVDISLQILKGVSCLHQYGIIHRDIKTTNILIERDANADEINVKLIDFGLSRVLGAYEESTDPYGSLSFKAPELLMHIPYTFKVDIWAVGITIYYLIFRTLPYEKGTKQQIKHLIINKEINYPLDQVNSSLSSNYSFLFALIGECLEKNVSNRPTIARLMQKYYEKYQLEEEKMKN